MVSIQRQHSFQGPTLTAVLATTPEIDLRGFAGGVVTIPAGSLITELKYYAGTQQSMEQHYGSEYAQLNKEDGTALTVTVTAGQAYALPSAVFGTNFLKIVASVGTPGQVWVTLKG